MVLMVQIGLGHQLRQPHYKRMIKKLTENQTHKMDMETLKHFDEGDYIGALEYIGVFE
jgi:hypothetical protein